MRELSKVELASVFGGCGDGSCDPPPEESTKGNNGWGNGEDSAPGGSLAHKPAFEDTQTGDSPSKSPASGNGNR